MSTQVTINDVIPRTQLIASGGQTVFNTNWTADVASDVVVYLRNAGTEANDVTQLVSTIYYGVTFIGVSETVRVTFLSGLTAGDIVTIVRDTPSDRENLYTNTNFTPSMLNQDFGILTLVDQQAQMFDEVITPRYNKSETLVDIVDTILPILGANQVWGKNSSDTAIIAVDIPTGLIPAPVIDGGTGKSSFTPYAPITGGITSTSPLQSTVLGATGTLFQSNGTSALPTFTTSTYPSTNAINTILYASSADVMAALPTANSSILVTGVSGIPSFSTTLPAFTTSGITFSPTTGGITGTTTNDNAAAGKVGEFISSTVLAAAGVVLTTNTIADVTSIALTAGDWDVWGNVTIIPAATDLTAAVAWIGSSSASVPDESMVAAIYPGASAASAGMACPYRRFSLAAPATIYLSCDQTFATTAKACGGIYARRPR